MKKLLLENQLASLVLLRYDLKVLMGREYCSYHHSDNFVDDFQLIIQSYLLDPSFSGFAVVRYLLRALLPKASRYQQQKVVRISFSSIVF